MKERGVPGCVVTDKLYQECVEESRAADKGRSASLLRAAKMTAVLRGLGYDGVHMGGPNLRYEDVEWVIGTSMDLSADWKSLVPEFDYPMPAGFYLLKGSLTGLNAMRSPLKRSACQEPWVRPMRFLHRIAFAKGAPLFGTACALSMHRRQPLGAGLSPSWNTGSSSSRSRCRRCGDCTLAEMAFLCPQSQCPKFLFNGQCGGSSGAGAKYSRDEAMHLRTRVRSSQGLRRREDPEG